MSERAEHAANAVLHATLTELARIEAKDLLSETITQQSLLPAAPQGYPAYNAVGVKVPYVTRLSEYNAIPRKLADVLVEWLCGIGKLL